MLVLPRVGETLWQAGRVNIAYDPHPDGVPDPGEVVWALPPVSSGP
jgi:hypothetical protein